MLSSKALALAFLLGLSFLFTGCSEEGTSETTQTSPSPISSFDKERLWFLIRFAGTHVQPLKLDRLSSCGKYFRAPSDTRYANKALECNNWALDMTDFLRLNGLPTLEPAHLKETVFWDWHDPRQKDLSKCFKGRPSILSKEFDKYPPCDEFAKWRQENIETSRSDSEAAAALGIVLGN